MASSYTLSMVLNNKSVCSNRVVQNMELSKVLKERHSMDTVEYLLCRKVNGSFWVNTKLLDSERSESTRAVSQVAPNRIHIHGATLKVQKHHLQTLISSISQPPAFSPTFQTDVG
ncbi:hypothetical protein MHYP_G00071690 [Metynnis hypsauchen]